MKIKAESLPKEVRSQIEQAELSLAGGCNYTLRWNYDNSPVVWLPQGVKTIITSDDDITILTNSGVFIIVGNMVKAKIRYNFL